jgi:Subtilase family
MSTIDEPAPQFTLPHDPDLAAAIRGAIGTAPVPAATGALEPTPLTFAAGGVAFLAGEVIVRGDDAVDRLTRLAPDVGLIDTVGDWSRFGGVEGVLPLVDALREEGHAAQPNHAFSASSCEHTHGCGLHPSLAARIAEEGVLGLLTGQPMRSQPMRSQPMRSQPMRSQPFRSQSRPPMSTARPAASPEIAPRRLGTGTRQRPLVVVFDTGVADPLPPLLQPDSTAGPDSPDVFGWIDRPDRDEPPDHYLDPVAGHGTFIAGIIQQLAPGCPQLHLPITSRFGVVDEWHVRKWLEWLPAVADATSRDLVLSMSFGGPTTTDSNLLEQAVGTAAMLMPGQPAEPAARTVLVAAAGNDGTCRPYFPAAWPTAVGVGAIGNHGVPDWTNYGPWVDACAPGTDLVSAFFTWNGDLPSINTVDDDDFRGWAVWSGTSFAVPVVVAALARTIVLDGVDAVTAADRVVRAPHLARVPGLGTVVNI